MAPKEFGMYWNSLITLIQAKWRSHISAVSSKPALSRWLHDVNIPGLLQQSVYFLETIWLFTRSDLSSIVGPQSAFGTLTALAANIFEQPSRSSSQTRLVMLHVPATVCWTYFNLLPFTVSNQRHPLSISEDMMNKPWRPMPSGRLTPPQALRLMIALYANAIVASMYLGGLKQSVALVVLGVCYNEAGGGNKSCILRNLINSCGFIAFASGAMEIALGRTLIWTWPLVLWFALIGLVVIFSIHSQDMYDTEGDRLRGRRTVPLVVGDRMARWSIAVSVTFFTLICLQFWSVKWFSCFFAILLGTVVAFRTLVYRDVGADKATFRLWNLWLVSLYCLPVLKHIEGPR